MSDYSKGQIYKITDMGQTKCYIGSSIQKLCKRMASHRRDYKKFLIGQYHYCSVFDLFDEFGVENCKIVWVKNHPCNSKEELEAEEGKHQKENQCVNRFIAGRSNKERYEDNKDIILERQKMYRDNNKDKIGEKINKTIKITEKKGQKKQRNTEKEKDKVKNIANTVKKDMKRRKKK